MTDIFKPTHVSFTTIFGTVHMVGFMNMFGASMTSYQRALMQMQVASEAQVHYALNQAVKS